MYIILMYTMAALTVEKVYNSGRRWEEAGGCQFFNLNRRPSAKGKDKQFSSLDTRHVEAEDDEDCSDGDGRGSKSESLGSDQMGRVQG